MEGYTNLGGAAARAPRASDNHLARNPTRATICLPFRAVLYSILMAMGYPTLLFASILRAIYKRVKWGKVSDILKYGGRFWPGNIPYDIPAEYPATWTFYKPFNPEKFKEVLYKMAQEAHMPENKVHCHFESEPPTGEFHQSGPLEADHYIPTKDTNIIKEFVRPNSPFAAAVKGKFLVFRIWNGQKGKPTLMHGYMPLNSWDGTSCFNFCKELIHRCNGGAPNDFWQGDKLTMKPETKELVDKNTSFARFLCRQPYCLFTNLSALAWQLVSCSPCFGGTGFVPEVTYLNFNEEDSARLAAGAKKKGIKPFAVFSYVAVKAFRHVFGENPHCIIQQSSLMTRHYEPKMERNMVGDWLIGVNQYIGGRKYGYLEAQEGYEGLLKDLDDLRRPAMRALEAKAWGLLGGGASLFEFLPAYCDYNRMMQSVFLNNYGIRSVSDDCGFHHYNWQAPYRFGFNTINVNGKTSIGIATGCSGLKKMEEARDFIHKTLREEFMS